MTTKLLKNIGVVKVNKEPSEYNDIYDVLQNLQNKKEKPKFDEENYKCKQSIINEGNEGTITDLTLNLTCDEGRILKYILLILLKFNNKKMIKDNLIDASILNIKINKIINSLREKYALYSSKDSLTINQQITSIISSFVLNLKPIVTQPVKPNSLKREINNFKKIANTGFDLLNIGRNVYKDFKKTAKDINRMIKNKPIKIDHIDLSDKPKNIYLYIINILESIRDKIGIIVRLNAQIKLDSENNKYIPINDICINGKKVLTEKTEKTDETDIKTHILIPEKCNNSDYEFNDFVFY